MADPVSTRRDFIKLTGAGLLAAAVPANGQVPLAPPDKQPPNLDVPPGDVKKMRYAVVGLGELALGQVMPAFGLCKVSRPTALVSSHPEKAKKVADTYGIDHRHLYNYDNFDKIADDDQIDIVYIILPNHMHAEYTERALKAGKAVLCEKPMAPSSEQCRRMIRTAEQTGKKLMIAYRLRYEPFNQKAIALVRNEQKFGPVRSLEAQNLQNTKAPNIRLSKATAGGPLGDVGIYCINAFRYLTGEEPVAVTGMVQQPADDPRFREVPEGYAFTLQFPSGALAHGACGFGSEVSRQYRVNCEGGWLNLANAFAYEGQRLTTSQGDVRSELTLSPVDHFAAEMDYFSECVLHDKPPLTGGEEGLADLLVIEAIRQAAAENRTIFLNGKNKAEAGVSS